MEYYTKMKMPLYKIRVYMFSFIKCSIEAKSKWLVITDIY